jgi:hypothetical protein
MTERWRRELAGVDEISPDVGRLRERTAHPPLSHTPSEPHRSRLVAGVTAMVVFVLAVSVYVIPAVRGHNDQPAPSEAASRSSGPLFVPGAPKSAAIAEVNRLMGLAHIPPGSQPRNHSPVRALNSPLSGSIGCSIDPCRYAIQTTAWWLMPMPMEQALSWLRSHPPAGLFLDGSAGSSNLTGSVSWTYRAGPSPVYTQAELSLAVAKRGAQKSVLRADAGVLWVPPRTAAEHVPANVEQVKLVKYKGDAVVARSTAHGDPARALAGLLNYLGRSNMDPPSCPFDGKNATHYTMTFPSSQGTFVFTEWTGCSGGEIMFVEVNGQTQPALSTSIQIAVGPVMAGPIEPYVECLLSNGSNCTPWFGPDIKPTDPVQDFCGGLHTYNDRFSTDVAQANGDDDALAASVKDLLGGGMMGFALSQQRIPDPQTRAEAAPIVADALAMQTWASSSGTTFAGSLDTFVSDSSAFADRYCA